MKFIHTLSVSTLALAMATSAAAANNRVGATNDPAYDPATVVSVPGTVASVTQVPSGRPLAGLHLMVKANADTFDVYLGPSDFLKFLKVSFPVGDQIQVTGSKVTVENADVILARKANDGYTLLTLRDANGAAVWQSWGREFDPALLR